MLQNVRVTAFSVSKLLRENQQGGGERELTPTPRLGLIGQVSPWTSIEAGEPQGTIL